MSWQKYHMSWWKNDDFSCSVRSCDKVQLDRVWLKMLKHLIYIYFLKDFWRLQNVTNCDKMTQCTWGLLCSITFDKSTSVKIVKFDSVKIIKFVKKSSQFVIYQIWWTSAYRLRVYRFELPPWWADVRPFEGVFLVQNYLKSSFSFRLWPFRLLQRISFQLLHRRLRRFLHLDHWYQLWCLNITLNPSRNLKCQLPKNTRD